MWHEARKQERKIRGMIVDFKRRAERRQDFYEKIKADPTQFMQIHGRKCKISLDPVVSVQGDAANIIVPWQGQKDNLIDRFDVRAHLDHIPVSASKSKDVEESLSQEERQCNYERYRILAQNDFLCLSEEKYLHQLYLEEQFGASIHQDGGPTGNQKKKSSGAGAAISYTYEDSEPNVPFSHILSGPSAQPADEIDSDDSNSDIDMDVSIEINKLDTNQAHELNACGRNYGMLSNDFYSYLNADFDEADAIRMAKEEEHEKMMLSGRKSRRERRAQRERRFAGRPMSPPSYAAKVEPLPETKEHESGNSRSPTPDNSGKITYITSFGGEDELQPHSKISINLSKGQGKHGTVSGSRMTYADKVKENLEKLKRMNEQQYRKSRSESPKKPKQYLRSRSRSPYRKRSRSRNRRLRSRSRSREYRRNFRGRTRSRSRSKSYDRYRKKYSKSPVKRRRRYSSSSSSSTSSSKSSIKSPKKLTTVSETKKIVQVENKKPIIITPELEKETEKFENILKSMQCENSTNIISSSQQQTIQNQPTKIEPPAPIKRYYGRKKENESSSNSEMDSDDGDTNENSNSDSNTFPSKSFNPQGGNSLSGITTYSSSSNLSNFGKNTITSLETTKASTSGAGSSKNLRERLKRKMQILLNKQYKADKQAEIERTERQIQQQEERENEMRELALRLRRRNRELRHKYGSPSPSSRDSSDDGDVNKKTEQALKEILGDDRRKSSRSRSRSKEKKPAFIRDEKEYPKRRRSGSRNRRRSRSRNYRRSRDRRRSRETSRERHSVRRRSKSRNRERDHGRQSSRRHSRSKSREKRNNSPKPMKKLVDY